jgi:GrpB-like predicted nucleotidyltransferase (UPF0157 family)
MPCVSITRFDCCAWACCEDRIDIQITVQNLDPLVEQAFNRAGYQRLEEITQDHLPPETGDQTNDWIKWIFRPPQLSAQQRPRPDRRAANQRYALLFRDYLRANLRQPRPMGR